MERQRVSSTTRLSEGLARRIERRLSALGALGALGLMLATGCASPLDKARTAWADGEGEFSEAEPLFQEAIAKDNDESEYAKEELFEIYVDLAAANKAEHPKDAEAYYRGALELDPESSDARTGLIRLLMTLYRYEEAFALANQGVTSGNCPGCRRLLAVMLIESGDQRSEAKDWPSAEAAYAAAMDLLPDASVALGLSRARVAQAKNKEASDALETAASMIDQNDIEGRRRFLELRKEIVLQALEANEVELADHVLDVAPKGVGANEQLGLAVEVAMSLTKAGKAGEALSRMKALSQAAEQGRLRVTDEQRVELLVRVALLHGARANQRLSSGDVEGASADLAEGLKLVPGEPTLVMQKALILGWQGEVGKAREELSQLSRKTPGYRTTDSILYAMEVDAFVKEGNLGDAAEALDIGKRADPTTPEIRVAAAQVLMTEVFDDMLKKEARELRKLSIIKYPRGKGRPVRVGEAMAEVLRAKKLREAQDELWPYHDPNFDERLKATEATIREFYPLPVEYIDEEQAVMVLKNTGAAELTVLAEGHRFFRKKKKIGAGQSVEITMGKPGLVTFTYGDDEKKAMFVAEPHTKVEISFPPTIPK